MTLGLIGCGIWGKLILNELLQLEVFIKVYDLNSKVREQIANRYPVEVHQGLNSLKGVDGVIIASDSSTHYQLLVELSNWDVPIFVEKPLTTSYEDALKLVSKVNHKKIFMMHIWRYHSGIQMLSELVRQKKVGEVKSLHTYRCNWTSPRFDTDTLWNLIPHDLTIALQILGYIPEPKYAVAEFHFTKIRNMVAILGNSPFVKIEISNLSPNKIREVRLQGTEAVAILKDENINYVEVYYGNSETYPGPSKCERFYLKEESALQKELKAFIAFLKGGAPPISTFYEGIETIRLVSQLNQMANKNANI